MIKSNSVKSFFYQLLKKKKGTEMGDTGKKDKGKREEQKKGKQTLKEKRKQKKMK